MSPLYPSQEICLPLVNEIRFGLFDSSFDRPHQILSDLIGPRSAQILHRIHSWSMANFRNGRTQSGFFENEWWSVFRVSDLAQTLGISDAAANSALDRLVAKGLLLKTSDTSEYRRNGYRGMGYRVCYGEIAAIVVEAFSQFGKAAWTGIRRVYKAISAFVEGTFEAFLDSIKKPKVEREAAEPAPAKPAPVRRKDETMNPAAFESLFTRPTPPQGNKTSAQVRLHEANIDRRHNLFAQHGLSGVNGTSLAGCSPQILHGLEAHLRELNPDIRLPLSEARVETWISRKYFAILAGGEEGQKAIAILRKCLAHGTEEYEILNPKPIEIVETDEEIALREKMKWDRYLDEHTWTRADLTDPRFGVDFMIDWVSDQDGQTYSLGEFFSYYDEHGKPRSKTHPISGKEIPLLRNIDYGA